MYKKIFKNMCFLSFLTLILTLIITLSISYTIYESGIINVLLLTLFLSFFILIFTMIIAKALTENILKPLNDIHSTDDLSIENIYEEIRPFILKITNQNKEIKRQMEKVKSQKTRLNTITDNMNEGLIIIDKDSNIMSMNNCALKIFDINEYMYKSKSFFSITNNQQILNSVSKALSGEKNDIIVQFSDNVYQIFSSPVLLKESISGVVILLFDITAKENSEQLRREFSANVSHELKTPLTSIHGYAQVISSGIAKAEDIQRFAQKIEKESSRLIILIEDIMKLSRLDENITINDKDEINLLKITNEVIESLSENAKEKNLEIVITGNDTYLYASLSQMTEMIYNLCDNAIKYNKQNGKIKIILDDKKFIISDTGIGIPSENQDRIFERFYRVDKSHSKKENGTGLGLSIVKHILKANNATISVESKVDEGTTFIVSF